MWHWETKRSTDRMICASRSSVSCPRVMACVRGPPVHNSIMMWMYSSSSKTPFGTDRD